MSRIEDIIQAIIDDTPIPIGPLDSRLEALLVGLDTKLDSMGDNQVIPDSDPYPNPNLLINGDFQVWQRGVSQTSNGYGSDDRWNNSNYGSTKTHSKQSDVINGILNFSRTIVTSVSGANYNAKKMQAIENVLLTAGKTVTLSFLAKVDSAKYVSVEFSQIFGTGGSTERSGIGVQKILLSTEWKMYTITVDIPSVLDKTIGANNALLLLFWFDDNGDFASRTSNLGHQSGIFDIAQVKLELGDKATPFVSRPYEEELLLCQRYYERGFENSSGVTHSTTLGVISVRFKVEKRNQPTASVIPGASLSGCIAEDAVAYKTPSSFIFYSMKNSLSIQAMGATYTAQFRPITLSTDVIQVDSEL